MLLAGAAVNTRAVLCFASCCVLQVFQPKGSLVLAGQPSSQLPITITAFNIPHIAATLTLLEAMLLLD
jgi:hypothetical protein